MTLCRKDGECGDQNRPSERRADGGIQLVAVSQVDRPPRRLVCRGSRHGDRTELGGERADTKSDQQQRDGDNRGLTIRVESVDEYQSSREHCEHA